MNTSTFVQKPNQWEPDHTPAGQGDTSPQHPNFIADSYIPKAQAPDTDLSQRVQGVANGARTSPYSPSDIHPMPNIRPRPSLSSSSTLSLTSTMSSLSATSSIGGRPLKLRVTSVLRSLGGPSAHVTPVVTDSYEDLVKSLRLIHEIDDSVLFEIIIRRTGGKLSQVNMLELRMNDVLDIGLCPIQYTGPSTPQSFQPLSPVQQRRPLQPFQPPAAQQPQPSSQLPQSPVSATWTVSPTSQPEPPPKSRPLSHTPLSRATFPSQHPNLHPAPASSEQALPPPTRLNRLSSSASRFLSRSPQVMSPTGRSSPRLSFTRRSSIQTNPPPSGSSLNRNDTISSLSSLSSVSSQSSASSGSLLPTYTDFHIVISPPIYEKGHISVFPSRPFTLTRTGDGVFSISTVSSIQDVLNKRFQGCPRVTVFCEDRELEEGKRLCDMGIAAGTRLRLVDAENYRLVPARVHDSLLEMIE